MRGLRASQHDQEKITPSFYGLITLELRLSDDYVGDYLSLLTKCNHQMQVCKLAEEFVVIFLIHYTTSNEFIALQALINPA